MIELRKEAQHNFYRWLLHRRTDRLSFRTIKQAAIQFLKPIRQAELLQEDESPLDLLFFPLLRSGVACYRGSSLYGLSPTCGVLLDDKVLLVNFPSLPSKGASVGSGLFLVDSTDYTEQETTTQFNLGKVLNQISSFEKIIQKSPDFSGKERRAANEWLVRRKGAWVGQESSGTESRRIELFKNSDNYGSPTNLKIGRIIFEIPSQELNPQAYALASMLTQLSNNDGEWEPVTLSEDGALRINLKVFPYQLEKCFLLESLRLGHIPVAFRSSRLYHVDPVHVPKLKQLFLLAQ
jgi:hypothetical protein